jgi:type II secretory pathway predicted ATPase ExeA
MNRRILDYFGVKQKTTYVSDMFRMFVTDVKNAVMENALLAIVGKYGAGKTEVVKAAKASISRDPDNAPIFIHVRSKDREKLRVGHILSAVIYDISQESVRQDMEARSRQFIRLVGQKHVKENRRICIVLDDAHMYHMNTLACIKGLREDDFYGVSPLFSVILIGQEPLAVKLTRRQEVLWRTQMLSLNENSGWMVYDDRVRYLQHVYGDAISRTARERIATLYRLPLEMDFHVEQKMYEAHNAGMTQLTEDAFEVSIQETLDALNAGLNKTDEQYISLDKIAREAHIGKTTVHDVLRTDNHNKKDPVKAALERLADKRKEQEYGKVVNG